MKLTEELLKKMSTTKYIVTAFREPDKIHYHSFVTAKEQLHPTEKDVIMTLINKNDRFTQYMEYLKYELAYYPFANQETIEFPLDFGAVLFLEQVLYDAFDDPYESESTQFYFLLDPAIESVKTASRRLSKSFSDKIQAFRDCIFYNDFGVQVTRQSTITSKEWLDNIYFWHQNVALVQDWSGGTPLLRDQVNHIQFRNRSFIMVHTAGSVDALAGIGVNRHISDEKSHYTLDTARSRITARGQKKRRGRSSSIFRVSSTPFGAGTLFHKNDQLSPYKWQLFAPMFCPLGYNKPVCYDCEHFTLTKFRKGELKPLTSLECVAPLPKLDDGIPDFSKMFKRIPDNRFVIKEFIEDWQNLTEEVWMQEYMCVTQEYSGTAINLNLIRDVIDGELERKYKSDLPCYVGVDFGLSEKHRSAIDVVGEIENGILVNLNTIILPAGTPYRTRDGSTGDSTKGVIETVLGLFNNYPNIKKIVADATGVGKEYVERDMVDLCQKYYGFNSVVAFKISPESKSPLWFGTVKPAMENGKVKSYMDDTLYMQMRAWRSEYDPSTQTKPRLTPPTSGNVQSDDALIAFFLAIWGALTQQTGKADDRVVMGSINPRLYEGVSAFERGAYGL